jgi:phage baseplate assembly protein W
MPRLPDHETLSFPLRIGTQGALTSRRNEHVRQQIEQVLFTNPGERVFRAEFGGGLQRMVFEPNVAALWEVTQRRLASSLAEALQGEVDPRSLRVEIDGRDPDTGAVGGTATIVVSYRLATIGQQQRLEIPLGGVGGGGG